MGVEREYDNKDIGMEWGCMAELVRYRVIEMLDFEDRLRLRLVSRRLYDMVEDVLRWENGEEYWFLIRLREYLYGERNYCWLRGGVYEVGMGKSIWLHIVYRGEMVRNYDRLGIVMNGFGLYYRFDDFEMCWYDGVYAIAIRRVGECEMVFEYTFLTSGCSRLWFKPIMENKYGADVNDGAFEMGL